MSWGWRGGQSCHREKYFMTLFLKRANRRPEHEVGCWTLGSGNPSAVGGRGGGARWLQDRKFGRKESTRMKTDLTDPPNDFTDKRLSGGRVSAFEVLLLGCFRFFCFCFSFFP